MQVRQAREQYVRWLLVAKDLSPHTIRAYESDIAALERHLGSRARVAQLDRQQLVGFIEEQRAAGLAPSSIRRRASGIRGFCKWLITSGRLQSDPLADITIGAARPRRLPRLLQTHDELSSQVRLEVTGTRSGTGRTSPFPPARRLSPDPRRRGPGPTAQAIWPRGGKVPIDCVPPSTMTRPAVRSSALRQSADEQAARTRPIPRVARSHRAGASR